MAPKPSWRDRYQSFAARHGRFVHPKIYGTTPRESKPGFRLHVDLRTWALLSAAGAAAFAAWFLFFSPAFAIETIDVVGTVTPDVLGEIQSLQGKNLLAYSSGSMTGRLRSAQSSIRTLAISKGLPNTLRIEVVQRTPVLRWTSGDTKYLLDEHGEAFQRGEGYTTTADDDPIPEVVDTFKQPINVGKPLVRTEFIAVVRALDREFPLRFPVAVDHYEIAQSSLQLMLVTKAGWRVYIDTTRSVEPQLDALKSVFEHFHDQIHEYVDLRVEGRAYYK